MTDNKTNIRPEIQALRAFSVGFVLLFHLWPHVFTGGYIGVDVFFVISGYLITSHLLRELESTGKVNLGHFWARRVRRLLPAAFLVLAVTLIATVVFYPETGWQVIVEEIAASAAYFLNWVLASNAVDYFASENSATAVQHYWSLSVEEQFYLVWPVLLLSLASYAKKLSLSPRNVIFAGIAVLAGLSLSYSVWYSHKVPAAAYFSTFTHAWEFAIGALVVFIGDMSGRVRLRVVASWSGFFVITTSAFLFSGETVFPGWMALIPVGGAILVIMAGDPRKHRLSPIPFLSLRPIQFLGDVSYSAYLWHWPLIIITPTIIEKELDTTLKLGILIITLLLAALTKRFVEDPARGERSFILLPQRAFGFAVAGGVIMVCASMAPWIIVEQRTKAAIIAAEEYIDSVVAGKEKCFGAAAMLSGAECKNIHSLDENMLFATIRADKKGEVTRVLSGLIKVIEYGAADAPVTVALVGDSHSYHYLPALEKLAIKNNWRLWAIRFNNCSPSAPTWKSSFKSDMSDKCFNWRQNLLEILPKHTEIDVIVTSSVAPRYANKETSETQSQIIDAFKLMWRSWTESGKKVVVIADVPGPDNSNGEARDCVAANSEVYDPCASAREKVLERDVMAEAAKESDASLLDLTDAYCDKDSCHVVVGGLVVYSGGAHISRLFSISLAPYIEASIKKLVSSE